MLIILKDIDPSYSWNNEIHLALFRILGSTLEVAVERNALASAKCKHTLTAQSVGVNGKLKTICYSIPLQKYVARMSVQTHSQQ